MTRFLTVTPREFERQRADVAGRPGPLDVVAKIAPRPLLIAHGSDDAWVPVEHARRLRSGAAGACRYVEMDGANHSFAWHRAETAIACSCWTTARRRERWWVYSDRTPRTVRRAEALRHIWSHLWRTPSGVRKT